jgi:7,8-dihydroneopterin aldolase/epimerase/oxygenase
LDTIFINDLRVRAVIGVHAWERRIEQLLCFDLVLRTDIRPAAASDDVALTIDYTAVCSEVESLAHSLRPQLIETLAEQLAARLLARFELASVRIRIHKPGAVASARSVGLEIEREALTAA